VCAPCRSDQFNSCILQGAVVIDDVGDPAYVDKNLDDSHAIAKLGIILKFSALGVYVD
jgi:hypothetical protein